MEERFFSDLWYRVANLRPALHAHVRLERRAGPRGSHYIAFDPFAGKTHRLTIGAAVVINQFDGGATVDEIWNRVAREMGQRAPSQGDVVRLLSQLHSADLLRVDLPADVRELDERRSKQDRAVLRQNLMGPMSFRVPIFDPNRLFSLTLPLLRMLISPLGFLLWLALVGWAGVQALVDWDSITNALQDQAWTATTLSLIAVTYVVVKAVHELGHGWVAKRYGAAVHEIGVMFLVFMPVPYVDATEVARLPSRFQRAAVSAAGIIVETALAAIAFLLWRDMEPGPLRAALFNVMLIGGVSTVLINGNPLLKFDGYFVMSDLLGLPNLAQRANRFWSEFTQKHLFGAEDIRERTLTTKERLVYTVYAPLAFAYRVFISLTIALFVSGQLFIVGVILGIWTLTLSLGRPVAKALWHLFTAPVLRKVRGRAVTISAAMAASVLLVLFALPLPHVTRTIGVAWVDPGVEIRSETGGEVDEILVSPGTFVSPGDALMRLADPLGDTRLAVLAARLDEARIRVEQDRVADPAVARLSEILEEDAQRAFEREKQRQEARTLRAMTTGRFQPLQPPGDLEGRFVQQGDLLGHVLPARPERIRLVITQAQIDAVRDRIDSVLLRLPGQSHQVHASRLMQRVPAAGFELPSPVLGMNAGGIVPTDPTDPDGVKTFERIFQFDAVLPETMVNVPLGGRVHVKLTHGWRPIGFAMVEWVRQRFLGGFDV